MKKLVMKTTSFIYASLGLTFTFLLVNITGIGVNDNVGGFGILAIFSNMLLAGINMVMVKISWEYRSRTEDEIFEILNLLFLAVMAITIGYLYLR